MSNNFPDDMSRCDIPNEALEDEEEEMASAVRFAEAVEEERRRNFVRLVEDGNGVVADNTQT